MEVGTQRSLWIFLKISMLLHLMKNVWIENPPSVKKRQHHLITLQMVKNKNHFIFGLTNIIDVFCTFLIVILSHFIRLLHQWGPFWHLVWHVTKCKRTRKSVRLMFIGKFVGVTQAKTQLNFKADFAGHTFYIPLLSLHS